MNRFSKAQELTLPPRFYERKISCDHALEVLRELKAEIEEAHTKIRALERAAVEDQEAYQLSLESFRRHNEAMKQNFEAHIAVERAEARDAAEQVANSHAQRVAQMTAEASARLRAMRIEVREAAFVVPSASSLTSC